MTTNVLILCTHNSARSVLSEAMLNHWAKKLGRDVRAFSAGSAPSGRINPFALEALTAAGIDVGGCRSKSWDEFVGEDAPRMRIVITVCDSAAAEAVPVLAGQPGQGALGLSRPVQCARAATKEAQAFELTRQAIGYRMLQLLQLPLETMSNAELQQALQAIAQELTA